MTTRRTVLKGSLMAGAGAVPVLNGLLTASAQDASPVASPVASPQAAGPTVIASGLMSPRGVAVAADGSVYVTEAGIGGDEELFEPAGPGTPEASPVAQAPFATRGESGQVTKIAPDGTISVVASGLTSYLIGGFEASGPTGIVLGDGVFYVSVGGPGPATGMIPPGNYDNRVVAIDEATGEITVLADIGAYEVANNPDTFVIEPNPYGMDMGTDGLLYVADAGGNTVYSVDPATGELAVVAVLPGIPLPEEMQQPDGNPTRNGAQELDPVPTGIAAAANGDIFVSLLSGGPFPQGAAKIQSISGGTVSDLAGGLTMATDVAIGPDGHLYAVQLSLNFLVEPPEAGNVVRVLENGSLEVVVSDLMLPHGIAFDAEGNLYIAAGTVTPPGAPPAGVVLRVDGVASPA